VLSRPLHLDADRFALWSADCQWIVAYAKTVGLKLAGPDGSGRPIVNPSQVLLNGREYCRHRSLRRSEPRFYKPRYCGRRCAHDSFTVEREYDPYCGWGRPPDGLYVDRFRTAYKPYDLAVTACLLMLAHRFGSAVVITSDGGTARWRDGQQLALFACAVCPAIPPTIVVGSARTDHSGSAFHGDASPQHRSTA
jgi:hypothetical protein